MCNQLASVQDLAAIRKMVTEVLPHVNSLEELENWFKAQPWVVSASSSNYLIKTEPPRQEITVTVRLNDGSTVTKAVTITLYPNGAFGLADIYDLQ